jgi:hypothetical protein
MRKRTTRLTVEACVAFKVRDLTRAGIFRLQPGLFHRCDWIDPYDGKPRKMHFRVEKIGIGATRLRVMGCDPNAAFGANALLEYTIGIAWKPCRFGGRRYWLICPLFRDGIACRRRVRKLFLPPGGRYFGCRTCHDLTYRSAQEHDQRVDRLSRLPVPQLAELLKMPASRMTFLALKAVRKKQERLLKLWKSSRNPLFDEPVGLPGNPPELR